ncbi:uncharacterized [Lates japonicus]
MNKYWFVSSEVAHRDNASEGKSGQNAPIRSVSSQAAAEEKLISVSIQWERFSTKKVGCKKKGCGDIKAPFPKEKNKNKKAQRETRETSRDNRNRISAGENGSQRRGEEKREERRGEERRGEEREEREERGEEREERGDAPQDESRAECSGSVAQCPRSCPYS